MRRRLDPAAHGGGVQKAGIRVVSSALHHTESADPSQSQFQTVFVRPQQTSELQRPGGGFDTVPEDGAVHSRQGRVGLHADTPGHHRPVRTSDTAARRIGAKAAEKGMSGVWRGVCVCV